MQSVDCAENSRAVAEGGRLDIPVIVIGGEESMSEALLRSVAEEVAIDVRHVAVPNVGHWIADEKPGELVEAILDFVRPSEAPADTAQPETTQKGA